MKKISGLLITLLVSAFFSVISHAKDLSITTTLYKTTTNKNLKGKIIGQLRFTDTKYGLLISPSFKGLPPGIHGFHLHQNPDCSDEGIKAGGHYDPNQTNSHLGPYNNGHLGDLPVLFVGSDGKANTPILAPRLKTSDIHKLAVMIHAGGDNYTNNPAMGGGGLRIGCGIIKN